MQTYKLLGAASLALLASCATQPVPISCPPPPPLPPLVTQTLPASTEGHLTRDLQKSFDALQDDLRRMLEAARVSPPR